MNALKVVGAIMGKLPELFGAVSEEKYRHLVRYVVTISAQEVYRFLLSSCVRKLI